MNQWIQRVFGLGELYWIVYAAAAFVVGYIWGYIRGMDMAMDAEQPADEPNGGTK